MIHAMCEAFNAVAKHNASQSLVLAYGAPPSGSMALGRFKAYAEEMMQNRRKLDHANDVWATVQALVGQPEQTPSANLTSSIWTLLDSIKDLGANLPQTCDSDTVNIMKVPAHHAALSVIGKRRLNGQCAGAHDSLIAKMNGINAAIVVDNLVLEDWMWQNITAYTPDSKKG